MPDRGSLVFFRSAAMAALVISCVAIPFFGCFGPALFRDRQFAYRDSAHYYYPLHQRVQGEWNAGRWPLWEPEENAGMSLLGNPTAAVLYPGKLVFALLPYAWGARIYIVSHTALALASMIIMLRSWHTSWVGSCLGGLAYAFAAPVLFQYCNVIYLVGAAWLPLGLRAVDRWVRLGRRWGLIELAAVLAMQTTGGDPESSYLLGLAGVAYAERIWWSRRSPGISIMRTAPRRRPWTKWLTALGLFGAWFTATVILAQLLPRWRPSGTVMPLPWMIWVPRAVAAGWSLAALAFLVNWIRRGRDFVVASTLAGLALAAGLAMAVSAAQLLPVVEFLQQTWRTADTVHETYQYSLEPFRVAELIWPNVLGARLGVHTSWIDAVQLPGARAREWVPSLYLGGLTTLLASSALAIRRGSQAQVWLTWIVILSLVLSFGEYTSPIWATRFTAAVTRSPAIEALAHDLGPLDRPEAAPIRGDGRLRDGDGGVYWWFNTILPGFRQFRFPSKLLTFTCLGLAGLAGLGWDRLVAGRSRKFLWVAALLSSLSLLLLAGVFVQQAAILALFRAARSTSAFGPFEPDAAMVAIMGGLAQAAVVAGLGLAAARLARSRPALGGGLAVVVMAVDLTVANSRYVITVPQSVMDDAPEATAVIDAAERAVPARGPFRIHRMVRWTPRSWELRSQPDRSTELVRWNRNTLAPKNGISLGLEYTYTLGPADLDDYQWLFAGFPATVRDAETARGLQLEMGRKFHYYPRRMFDIWNTRYFIVPFDPGRWQDPTRSYAAFLAQCDVLYPEPSTMRGPANAPARARWADQADFQVLENPLALPRAWVVHSARAVPNLPGTGGVDRRRLLEEMAYSDDIWHEDNLKIFNPRTVAWLDNQTLGKLAPFLSGHGGLSSEKVTVTYPATDRAILDVNLATPGLVILSDTFYPGWELTIDGKPAPIYRVNQMMRGAAVAAGTHQLIYAFRPQSFATGLVVSTIGAIAIAFGAVICAARPVDHRIAETAAIDQTGQ